MSKYLDFSSKALIDPTENMKKSLTAGAELLAGMQKRDKEAAEKKAIADESKRRWDITNKLSTPGTDEWTAAQKAAQDFKKANDPVYASKLKAIVDEQDYYKNKGTFDRVVKSKLMEEELSANGAPVPAFIKEYIKKSINKYANDPTDVMPELTGKDKAAWDEYFLDQTNALTRPTTLDEQTIAYAEANPGNMFAQKQADLARTNLLQSNVKAREKAAENAVEYDKLAMKYAAKGTGGTSSTTSTNKPITADKYKAITDLVLNKTMGSKGASRKDREAVGKLLVQAQQMGLGVDDVTNKLITDFTKSESGSWSGLWLNSTEPTAGDTFWNGVEPSNGGNTRYLDYLKAQAEKNRLLATGDTTKADKAEMDKLFAKLRGDNTTNEYGKGKKPPKEKVVTKVKEGDFSDASGNMGEFKGKSLLFRDKQKSQPGKDEDGNNIRAQINQKKDSFTYASTDPDSLGFIDKRAMQGMVDNYNSKYGTAHTLEDFMKSEVSLGNYGVSRKDMDVSDKQSGSSLFTKTNAPSTSDLKKPIVYSEEQKNRKQVDSKFAKGIKAIFNKDTKVDNITTMMDNYGVQPGDNEPIEDTVKRLAAEAVDAYKDTVLTGDKTAIKSEKARHEKTKKMVQEFFTKQAINKYKYQYSLKPKSYRDQVSLEEYATRKQEMSDYNNNGPLPAVRLNY